LPITPMALPLPPSLLRYERKRLRRFSPPLMLTLAVD